MIDGGIIFGVRYSVGRTEMRTQAEDDLGPPLDFRAARIYEYVVQYKKDR
jgi:hypothetical protein